MAFSAEGGLPPRHFRTEQRADAYTVDMRNDFSIWNSWWYEPITKFVLALALCAFTAAGHGSPEAVAEWTLAHCRTRGGPRRAAATAIFGSL